MVEIGEGDEEVLQSTVVIAQGVVEIDAEVANRGKRRRRTVTHPGGGTVRVSATRGGATRWRNMGHERWLVVSEDE